MNDPRSEIPESPQSPETPETPDPAATPAAASPADSGADDPPQPQPIEAEPPEPPESPADRPGWGARLRSGWAMFVYVVALVGSLITIWAYVEFKLDDGAIDASLIRAQLLASVDATYDKQRADAEKIVGDWQAREQALEAAKVQRDAQLARINDLAEEIKRIATGPEAEGIAQSLARILQEQGPSAAAALDYIETKRDGIVARIRERRAANRARDREELGPLLASAGLYAAEGEAQSARERYAEVVALAPDWPEALDAHRGFLIDQGDLAVIRGTLDPAEQDFALARQRVDALIALEPDEPRWQRNLGLCLGRTGDLKVARGDLDGAQQAFERSLAIAERLAAAEPGNAGWQRDLSVSLNKLGDLKVARGDLDGAQQAFERSLAIAERLAAAEPGNAGWQRDLSVSLNKLGNLKVARGDLDGAQQAFEDSQAIFERLAAAEPGNAGWQRDLAVSHFKLGRVADARDDEPALARYWGAMLAIFDALDQAGLHISPSDRAGLQGIRARVEAASPAAATEGD